ncbi:MAG: hypothetical protein HYY14_03060 [Candidatus Omnitrophica bacterium]|nr:hypothetical protein [Candidatus Omnitrophota bacterium]
MKHPLQRPLQRPYGGETPLFNPRADLPHEVLRRGIFFLRFPLKETP